MSNTGILAVVALLGGCAPLAELFEPGKVTDFANVDRDGDSSVARDEFAAWGDEQGLFSMMGGTQGILDPLDLASGLYGLWDMEGSGITEAEWTQGIEAWFPDADAGMYTDWDLNADNLLDEDELRAGFAHTGIAESWDADKTGEITDKEFYEQVYGVFDTDGDDVISEREWNTGITDWGWSF